MLPWHLSREYRELVITKCEGTLRFLDLARMNDALDLVVSPTLGTVRRESTLSPGARSYVGTLQHT